jgi:hypothetical protein
MTAITSNLTPAKLQVKRMEAQEYRRRLAQGLGRPIMSYERDGKRYVRVGDTSLDSQSWQTFHDFLFDYIRQLFTPEWANAELKKPDSDAHPLILWYRKLCEFQRTAARNSVNGVYTAHPIGAVRAYLGLAYDLYLCAHNAKIQDKLLRRLRNKDQFESAVYEAFVIGCFIKAGYSVEFEDEDDSSRSHCEFTARHLVTGRKFSVEAKAIKSTSNRAGSSVQPPRFGDRLAGALKKEAEHERIIFIDLSRAENFSNNAPPDWVSQVEKDIRAAESWIFDGNPAPSAYLFITNSGFLHALDSTTWSELRFITGFKIDDFPIGRKPSRILDFVRAREKHIEIVWLHEALEAHNSIPSTFDGRTPEEVFSGELLNRPRIGDNIGVADKSGNLVIYRLLDAQVDTRTNEVFAQLQTADGQYLVGTFPLTEAEVSAYKREPNTFFDVVKPISKEPQNPLDCFDFLWEIYQHSTKETLLSFMKDWPGNEAHAAMSQKELAEIYCEAMASRMWVDREKGNAAKT